MGQYCGEMVDWLKKGEIGVGIGKDWGCWQEKAGKETAGTQPGCRMGIAEKVDLGSFVSGLYEDCGLWKQQ